LKDVLTFSLGGGVKSEDEGSRSATGSGNGFESDDEDSKSDGIEREAKSDTDALGLVEPLRRKVGVLEH
jgi:hypothetical protein